MEKVDSTICRKFLAIPVNKRFVLTGIASALLLGACGNADASEDDQESAANPDAETIVVGTGNAYQPFVYLDENGELDGYDVAVLKAVDEKLDQYNFEYESSDFKNILTSLQTGKVDLAAHQYQYNDERAEKYLFGEVGYNNITLHIISIEGEGEYNSLDDLQGKMWSPHQELTKPMSLKNTIANTEKMNKSTSSITKVVVKSLSPAYKTVRLMQES